MYLICHWLFGSQNDSIPSPRRNIVSAIEQIASFYTAGFRITKTINMIVRGICWQEYRLAATAAIIYQYRASRIQSRNKTPRGDHRLTFHSPTPRYSSWNKVVPIKASVLLFFGNKRTWSGLILKNISWQQRNQFEFSRFLDFLEFFVVNIYCILLLIYIYIYIYICMCI